MGESFVEYYKRKGIVEDSIKSMENHLRNQNYVTNLRIALDSRNSPASASWQISNNNESLETKIKMNREVLQRK